LKLSKDTKDNIVAGIIIAITFFTVIAGDGILTVLGW
tara:strand:- start:631 stop:741 length:111 start_codon:yes stop_codon:yes gene_type:complete